MQVRRCWGKGAVALHFNGQALIPIKIAHPENAPQYSPTLRMLYVGGGNNSPILREEVQREMCRIYEELKICHTEFCFWMKKASATHFFRFGNLLPRWVFRNPQNPRQILGALSFPCIQGWQTKVHEKKSRIQVMMGWDRSYPYPGFFFMNLRQSALDAGEW